MPDEGRQPDQINRLWTGASLRSIQKTASPFRHTRVRGTRSSQFRPNRLRHRHVVRWHHRICPVSHKTSVSHLWNSHSAVDSKTHAAKLQCHYTFSMQKSVKETIRNLAKSISGEFNCREMHSLSFVFCFSWTRKTKVGVSIWKRSHFPIHLLFFLFLCERENHDSV